MVDEAKHNAVYHVSIKGSNEGSGDASSPLRTITAAANLAQPGDLIIVHQGVYRERIDPPRGGSSDESRITYRAAEGERVTPVIRELTDEIKKLGPIRGNGA